MVLLCGELPQGELVELLGRYGLSLTWLAKGSEIPGSYWGESEAGLIGHELLVRDDTPLHSAFHEACHYICMDQARRDGLHTDAGGTMMRRMGLTTCKSCSQNISPSVGVGGCLRIWMPGGTVFASVQHRHGLNRMRRILSSGYLNMGSLIHSCSPLGSYEIDRFNRPELN